MFFMSSSHRKEAPISEPFACAECGKTEVVSVVETCHLSDGLAVKRLRHYKCGACGARLFDDAAMHRIQQERAEHPAMAAR
jgi:transcription elongation factor Elf1